MSYYGNATNALKVWIEKDPNRVKDWTQFARGRTVDQYMATNAFVANVVHLVVTELLMMEARRVVLEINKASV